MCPTISPANIAAVTPAAGPDSTTLAGTFSASRGETTPPPDAIRYIDG